MVPSLSQPCADGFELAVTPLSNRNESATNSQSVVIRKSHLLLPHPSAAYSVIYSTCNNNSEQVEDQQGNQKEVFHLQSLFCDFSRPLEVAISPDGVPYSKSLCSSASDTSFLSTARPFLDEQHEYLDETLIHSSFVPQDCYDFCIPFIYNNQCQWIFVTLRPGLLHFLHTMSKVYEIVVYTASIDTYANRVLDVIDPYGCISHRLYRNHCTSHKNTLVKDLSLIGRNLNSVVIVDNSHKSFQFQPENGIECKPFVNDIGDCELSHLEPFLLYLSKKADIRKYTCLWESTRCIRCTPSPS